jgi:hypothetical protein
VRYYHWLGEDAEKHVPYDETMRENCPEMFIPGPPLADEQAQYAVIDHPNGGFTARLEGDDWITIYTYPKQPTA